MAPAKGKNILFDTVAIAGVGLIGGSLGLAAKKNGLARRVIGIGRSEQKLMRAKILGAIDDYSMDFENGASDADLLIICTPVRTIVPTLERMAASLKEGAVATDAGSTKREIVRQAGAMMPKGRYFVGGHPMAGSEQAGVENASADLFVGATYVVTHANETSLDALGKVVAFAEGIGARVEVMTPEVHDLCVAVISHLPHVISGTLLQVAEDAQRQTDKLFRLAAGSFRDLTRISDSPPEIWQDICTTNADFLIDVIGRLQGQLADIKVALMTGDEAAIARFFEEARAIRQAYLRIAK